MANTTQKNEFKKDRNAQVVNGLLNKQDLKQKHVIELLDLIFDAASCFVMAAIEFPKTPLIREITDIDVEILSEVCFQLEIQPRQEYGKFTGIKDYGISRVILKSK